MWGLRESVVVWVQLGEESIVGVFIGPTTVVEVMMEFDMVIDRAPMGNPKWWDI